MVPVDRADTTPSTSFAGFRRVLPWIAKVSFGVAVVGFVLALALWNGLRETESARDGLAKSLRELARQIDPRDLEHLDPGAVDAPNNRRIREWFAWNRSRLEGIEGLDLRIRNPGDSSLPWIGAFREVPDSAVTASVPVLGSDEVVPEFVLVARVSRDWLAGRTAEARLEGLLWGIVLLLIGFPGWVVLRYFLEAGDVRKRPSWVFSSVLILWGTLLVLGGGKVLRDRIDRAHRESVHAYASDIAIRMMLLIRERRTEMDWRASVLVGMGVDSSQLRAIVGGPHPDGIHERILWVGYPEGRQRAPHDIEGLACTWSSNGPSDSMVGRRLDLDPSWRALLVAAEAEPRVVVRPIAEGEGEIRFARKVEHPGAMGFVVSTMSAHSASGANRTHVTPSGLSLELHDLGSPTADRPFWTWSPPGMKPSTDSGTAILVDAAGEVWELRARSTEDPFRRGGHWGLLIGLCLLGSTTLCLHIGGSLALVFRLRNRLGEQASTMERLRQEAKEDLVECARRIRDEERLQHRRELGRFQEIFHGMGQGVVVQNRDLSIIEANRAAELILGLTRDQLEGRSSVDPRWMAMHENLDAFPGTEHPIAITLGSGKPTLGVVMGVHNSAIAQTKWILIDAFPIHYPGDIEPQEAFTVFTDITSLREAREEASSAKEQLAYALDATGEGVWDWNVKDDVVRHNRAWCRILGLLDEYLEHPVSVFAGMVHESDRALVEERIRLALEKGESYQSEHRMWCTDGRAIWVRDRGRVVLRDKDGAPLRVVGAMIDITSERLAKEDAQHALAQAEDARLHALELARAAEVSAEAKSRFLAVMSHELRTPLNGVVGMADLLLDTVSGPEEKDWIRTIKRSGTDLLGMIDGILEHAQMESGSIPLEERSVVLEAFLRDVMANHEPRTQSTGVKLSWTVSAETPKVVWVDPGRLRQILFHLVGNAAKFTAKGSIALAVSGDGSRPGWMRFEVSDTGTGISPENLERLFEPFTQLDGSDSRRHGGAGLGLAIARKVVALLGGVLEVESVVGKGSVFWFSIPVGAVDA